MKRFLVIIMLLIILLPVYSLRNWKIYTNTTHIYDSIELGDKLFLATWGGLVEFDMSNKVFSGIRTNIDGLSDNDLRTLDYLKNVDQLLVGSYNAGIDRISGFEFDIPLTETIGLASNTVNKIVHNDSLIIVATKFGVSVFQQVEDFPFPILIDNFDVYDGLSAENITSLELTESGMIICGSEAGVDYTFVDSLGTFNAWNSINTENSAIPGDQVTSLSSNSEWLAIGTKEGLAKVKLPEFINWNVYEEIIEDTLSSVFPVYMDPANNLWYSFGYWEESKLDILNNGSTALGKIDAENNIEQWTADELELPTEKIFKITQQQNGDMMLLTWGYSLVLEDNGTWQTYEQNSPAASLVKEVMIDQNDQVWTCSGYIPPPNNVPLPRGTAGVSSYKDEVWINYSAEDSPLLSDNIFSMEVDQDNRKWFGTWYVQSDNPYGWDDGISIFDDENEIWDSMDNHDGIRNNSIADLYTDDQNRIWVCSFTGTTGGITVVDAATGDILGSFDLHDSVQDYHDAYQVHVSDQKAYFGGYWTGLRIWNDNSIPVDDGYYWSTTPFSDLQSDRVNDILTITRDGREELWVASENGLFNLAWSKYFIPAGAFTWYKYGTVIKRMAWHNNGWYDEESPEFWYIEGQERLFGSVPTFPTTLMLDPFNNIWIGTDGNGLSVYSLDNDTFQNYNMDNSPLISNKITDLAYDEKTGNLYVGTDKGLHSVEIGISASANQETDLTKAVVYPNPFYPEKGEILRIENKNRIAMPRGETVCYIYDLAGDLVLELEKDIYEQFSWNGLNHKNKKCGSGLYFYVIATPDGQTLRGKIALIR